MTKTKTNTTTNTTTTTTNTNILLSGGCPTCDMVGGYCGGSGHPDCGATVLYGTGGAVTPEYREFTWEWVMMDRPSRFCRAMVPVHEDYENRPIEIWERLDGSDVWWRADGTASHHRGIISLYGGAVPADSKCWFELPLGE
jgi:hypothetical protein